VALTHGTRRWKVVLVCLTLPVVVLVVATSVSGAPARRFAARLTGYQVVPAVSTSGVGRLVIKVLHNGDLFYRLTYSVPGSITQAHIHFAQPGVNGGILAFLCTNLGNGPAGTPSCPASPATVTGTINSAAVIGPSSQGIAAGELSELVRALRQRVTYADVHTTLYPAAEMRAQVKPLK